MVAVRLALAEPGVPTDRVQLAPHARPVPRRRSPEHRLPTNAPSPSADLVLTPS